MKPCGMKLLAAGEGWWRLGRCHHHVNHVMVIDRWHDGSLVVQQWVAGEICDQHEQQHSNRATWPTAIDDDEDDGHDYADKDGDGDCHYDASNGDEDEGII